MEAVDDTHSVEAPDDEQELDILVQRTLDPSVDLICSVDGDKNSIILLLNIGGLAGRFIFDSGSDLSLVSSTFLRNLGAFLDQLPVPELFL